MISSIREGCSIHFIRQMLVVALLSFTSAIPFTLLHSGINTWLAVEGVQKAKIGFFSVISLPYTLKFIVAPFLDAINIPWIGKLGKRFSWIFLTQVGVLISIAMLALVGPKGDLMLFALMAIVVAVFSAMQDIVVDAYRAEIVEARNHGTAASIAIFGYRVGILFAGGFGLLFVDYLCRVMNFCEDYINWVSVFIALGCIVPISSLGVLWYGDPSRYRADDGAQLKGSFSGWLMRVIRDPFKDFTVRISRWWLAALFILLYRSCDAFISLMMGPFLVDKGFSLGEIGKVIKTFGFVASVIGGFIGGFSVHKMGVKRSLYLCGVLQMSSNLMFVLQNAKGYDIDFLYLTIAVENVCGGMASIAFVAYAMSICSRRYAATQYALMTSLAALDKLIMGTCSGIIVEVVGWTKFFLFSACLGFPPLIMIYFLHFSNQEESILDPQERRGE